MHAFSRHWLFAASLSMGALPLAVMVSGCAADVAPVVIHDEGQGAEHGALELSPQRLYLGDTNLVEVSTDLPRHHGVIDLEPDTKIALELTSGHDDDALVLSVYKLTDDQSLRHLGALEGEGVLGAILTTPTGGTFVIESTSDRLPQALRLDVSCLNSDGRCASLGQPGDSCGSRGLDPCEEGLFCRIDEGCGRDDRGGVCALPAQYCPAYVAPVVCGCDGQEYQGACDAHQAAVNVDHPGACACDPSRYDPVDDNAHPDVTGLWQGKTSDEHFVVSSRLELSANRFFYEQVLEPHCLLARPQCRALPMVFSMFGTWERQGDQIALSPESDAPTAMTQSFTITDNCEGDVQLSAVESGQERILLDDPCAAVTCGAQEECELQQVQCITAPCLPIPVCVP